MTPTDYFDGSLVALVAGVATAGVPTVATCWHRSRGGQSPAEPGYSVGLLLSYPPAAYAIGGLLAFLMPSSNAVLNAILVGLLPVTMHIRYLYRRLRPAAAPALPATSNLTDLTGITSCFTSGDTDELRRLLREDLTRQRRARVVSPSPKVLFGDSSILGSVLKEAAVQGATFDVAGNEDVDAPSDLGLANGHRVIGGGQMGYPGEWHIIAVGSVVYFGYGSLTTASAGQMFYRGLASIDPTPAPAGRKLTDVMLATVEDVFSWAYQPEAAARVTTTSSPRAYRSRIVPAEAGASIVDRIPKRLSVMFKGEQTVRTIAQQRFGAGSPSVAEYVAEHEARRQEFFGALARGMRCREIYNKTELIAYVTSRKHSSTVLLSNTEMRDTIHRWRQAIDMYDNYNVAITVDPLPFKYELVDDSLVVMHEAVGVSDLRRLNAIFVQSSRIGRDFMSDFEVIWERTPPDLRGRQGVLKFIDDELIPLVS